MIIRFFPIGLVVLGILDMIFPDHKINPVMNGIILICAGVSLFLAENGR